MSAAYTLVRLVYEKFIKHFFFYRGAAYVKVRIVQ